MNWKLAEKINKIKGLTAVQRSILFALAGYANEKNQCWPAVLSIAETAGVSKRYTILTLRELEKMKILSVKYVSENEKTKTNIYTILVEINEKESIFRDDLRSSIDDLGMISDQGGDDPRSGGGMILDQGGDDLRSSEVDTLNRYTRTDTENNKKTNQKNKILNPDQTSSDITNPVKLELKLKFDIFWDLYPRKRNKKAAQKKFSTIVGKKINIADEIIEGTKQHAKLWKTKNTKIEYIPNPETFLNKGSYEDDLSKQNTTIWDKYL
jgi:hypothetical protein